MNIEFRFLQKAIEDKNFVSFSYENNSYKKVKPIKMNDDKISCDMGSFEISKLKKLTVLRERF
jgi:predicted DNA-binding transcriptional regulator YafY